MANINISPIEKVKASSLIAAQKRMTGEGVHRRHSRTGARQALIDISVPVFYQTLLETPSPDLYDDVASVTEFESHRHLGTEKVRFCGWGRAMFFCQI